MPRSFSLVSRTKDRQHMKRQLRVLYSLLVMLGFDPLKAIYSIRGLSLYFRDLKTLRSQRISAKTSFPFGKYYPCLEDRFSESGSASGHYFHQDLLAARRIFLNSPNTHIDVGSRIDGFVAHVASFRPIEVVDIRRLSSNITNIKFIQVDLMEDMKDDLVDCCDSLSCLHALEHFGLGRYGDPLNMMGILPV